MKLFSQREGFKPVKGVLQLKGMDDELLNGLWNALQIYYWDKVITQYLRNTEDTHALITFMWLDHFKKPIDTIAPAWEQVHEEIRSYFFHCRWFEVYDFVEFAANNYTRNIVNEQFIKYCNYIMERELSGYRFIGKTIAPITSKEEITEMEEVLEYAGSLKPVTIHMKESLKLFSDRKSPDYRNSIKESISAVETICAIITGNPKATLGDALGKIRREGKVSLHPSLNQAFEKLYGYTSDEDGIRHRLMSDPDLDFEDAKFMLVACSAFINYLKVKASKAGINFQG